TIALLILLFAPVFVRLFNPDEEVIYYGSLFLRVMALFRILTPIFQGGLGALRGLGKSKTAMAIMVFSLVFARQGYLYLITQVWNSVYAVALGYPVAWGVCDLILLVYFLRFDWEAYAERRVV
ncbi:MAG: MATE family efflux transporter, partial [Erysipelotrichales bacterium]|nr:MATE family efflux transporter [Erysipelotrichales bacterium]